MGPVEDARGEERPRFRLTPAREGWLCFATALLVLFAVHAPILDLPYHWDELGQFVPNARDIREQGAFIPTSVAPNVHPPLVPALVAGAWGLAGVSVVASRSLMLVLTALAITAAFLLARRLSDRGAAWTVVGLLLVSPVFVSQSMLVHLDLPAAAFALLALLAFLARRWGPCALAGTLCVLAKETGIVVPFVLAFFLRRERRAAAIVLLPPSLVLAAWLVVLKVVTGHWTGDAEFASYNVTETLRLEKIPLLLLFRLYKLLVADFHWIAGVLVFVGWRRGAYAAPAWRVVFAIVAVYVVVHSLVGGAPLLRYLLPAFALLYVAASAALARLAPLARRAGTALLLAGFAAGNLLTPLYPYAWEDDLSVVDYVRVQEEAARWLEANARGRHVTTAWPFASGLRHPLFGYVEQGFAVEPIDDFKSGTLDRVDSGSLDLFVLFERNAEPTGGTLAPVASVLARVFRYERQEPRGDVVRRLGLRSLARFSRGPAWVEVFDRER